MKKIFAMLVLCFIAASSHAQASVESTDGLKIAAGGHGHVHSGHRQGNDEDSRERVGRSQRPHNSQAQGRTERTQHTHNSQIQGRTERTQHTHNSQAQGRTERTQRQHNSQAQRRTERTQRQHNSQAQGRTERTQRTHNSQSQRQLGSQRSQMSREENFELRRQLLEEREEQDVPQRSVKYRNSYRKYSQTESSQNNTNNSQVRIQSESSRQNTNNSQNNRNRQNQLNNAQRRRLLQYDNLNQNISENNLSASEKTAKIESILQFQHKDGIPVPNKEMQAKYGKCQECNGSGLDKNVKKYGVTFTSICPICSDISFHTHSDCPKCYGCGYKITPSQQREINKFK